MAQPQMQGQDPNVIPGYWVPHYEIVSGQVLGEYSPSNNANGKGSYVFNFASKSYEGAQPSDGKSGAHTNSGGQAGAASSSGRQGGAASLELKGLVVKVTYKWEKQQYGTYAEGAQLAPPDAKLNFVLNAGASASAANKLDWGYPAAGRDTSNEKVFVSIDGKKSPDDALTYVFTSAGHLFSFDTQGQTEFSGTMPIEANASIAGNRGYDAGGVSLDFNFGAQLDDRSVTLSREGAINEWYTNIGGVPVTHGDTIYSFTEHQAAQTPEYVPVPQKFTSTLVGDNWSTGFAPDSGGYDITWNWVDGGLEKYFNPNPFATNRQSEAGSYTRWNGMSRVTPKGELEAWYGALGNTPPTYTDEGNPDKVDADGNKTKRGGRPPETKTVKYFARDNQDQAEAEARYELTVHEPIELVGKKQFVKRYNITSPAYKQDPADGKWKLVAALNGDATHTYKEGEYAYSVTRGEAKARGWSAEFGGGLGLGVEAVIGYSHNEEVSWSKEYGGTATLSENIGPGEAAYLEVVFPRQIFKQEFRLFNQSGEMRSPESPAIPAPSIPYSKAWEEEESAATERWHKVKPNEPVPSNEDELPIIQGDSGGSS